MIPVPISTPGFDNAPYLTSANWITKDIETGIYNIGNYRSQIKSADRTGGLFTSQHMGQHWRKAKAKGQRLEACIAIGVMPSIAYSATAKIPYDFDEYRLAGGLAGEPVELVRAKSVDLLVPATAEIIIEGTIPTDVVEPEGPFGEYPGYMGHRTVSPFLEVTCITQRRDAIYTALMSQFPPSESSKIKHTGTEKIIYKYIRHDSGNSAVIDVALHDEVSGSGQAYCVIKMRNGARPTPGARSMRQRVLPVAMPRFVSPSMKTSISTIRRWSIGRSVTTCGPMKMSRSPKEDAGARSVDLSAGHGERGQTARARLRRCSSTPYGRGRIRRCRCRKRSSWNGPNRFGRNSNCRRSNRACRGTATASAPGRKQDEEEADLAVKGDYFETGTKQTGQRKKT